MTKTTEYSVISTNLGATIEQTSGVLLYNSPDYTPNVLAELLAVTIKGRDTFEYAVSDTIFTYLSLIKNIDAIISRLLVEQTQPRSQLEKESSQPSVTLETLSPALRLILDIFYLSHGENKYAPDRYSTSQLQYLAENCKIADPNLTLFQEVFNWLIEAQETIFTLNLMAYLAFVEDDGDGERTQINQSAKKYIDELKSKLEAKSTVKEMRELLVTTIQQDLELASLDVEDGLIHWAIISKAVDEYIFPEKGRFLVNFRDFTDHDSLRAIYKALRDWRLQVTLPAPKTN